MWWAIVSDKIEHIYQSDTQNFYAGEWGIMEHIQIPDDIDPTCVIAIRDPDTNIISFQLDPVKVATKNTQALIALRAQRKLLLIESDWTQLQNNPLSTEKITEWATYRQALRDLPDNTTDPTVPIWPTPPS
jgi:hypothetical protein